MKMKLTLRRMPRNFLLGILPFLSLSVQAGTPVLNFTPLTNIILIVNPTSIINVQYIVTNNSHVTHVLAMTPIAGITSVNVALSSRFCSNPFTLAYQQSCILNLRVNGAALQGNVSQAPVVCDQDNFVCYRPSQSNQLKITLANNSNLVIGNSPLNVVAGGAPGTISITNTSATTAVNLRAEFTGTALAENVMQDASHCSSLAPGQICTLTFTALQKPVPLTSFAIVADNLSPASGQLQVASQ
jgi:hypothetical protein